MKQPLRPQWQDVSHDAATAELAAAAETEQGLEDFADLFAAELNQLQQEQQQFAPRSVASANKRRRSHRELVSINFGSQDAGGSQAAAAPTMQDDEDVDLITPPWLQPKTKSARNGSNPSGAGSSRLAQHTAADTNFDAGPGQDAAVQHAGQSRPPQRTPPAQMQAAAAPVSAPAQAAGHAAAHAPGHAGFHAPGYAADSDQEEDVICDNSSDDFEPPSSTRRVAAHAVGSSAGKRPGSGHRPASGAAGAAGHARTPASAGASRLLDSLLGPSPSSIGRPSTQRTQRQQQHQQQQQFRAAGTAADGSGDAWVPPKYKQPTSTQGFAAQHTGFGAGASQHPQQQYRQQPGSTQQPPGLLERQQPAMTAAATGAGGGQFGPGGYGVPGPCAGGADVDQAWWWVLPDFVPVEVLLQQQCNPRDGTPVYINYKSQFKDGGSATAPKGRTAAKQTKGNGKRGAAAAAAAAGGPTGFMTAAWLDQQQGKGSGGRSKGRKRRSRKGKGAEGGSGGSSGGRRKRGSGGGRWSTVNGQKVFISNNGSRLTGSSAYKAYKGIGK